jgi:hypothetical protein
MRCWFWCSSSSSITGACDGETGRTRGHGEGAAGVQMTTGYSMFDTVFVWPRCGQDKELVSSSYSEARASEALRVSDLTDFGSFLTD